MQIVDVVELGRNLDYRYKLRHPGSRWPSRGLGEITSFGGLRRSHLMSRIASRNNQTTELKLAGLLRRHQIRGWRRHQKIAGKPDFVWPKNKIALFVDGCFWHGHNCRNLRPATNAAAWSRKILRTRARDRRANRKLRGDGWVVIRIWECSLKRNPERCVGRILRAFVRSSRGHVSTFDIWPIRALKR